MMAYYKTRYVPNNIFFVVAGDVDAQAVHDQLAAAFENCPRQALPPVYIPQEPQQLVRREEHIEFPATELTRMEIAWHIPEVTHPDVPALDVLAQILGDGRSSRLYRRVREELALVHGIGVWCYTPGQPGLFGVEALLERDRDLLGDEDLWRREEGGQGRPRCCRRGAGKVKRLQSVGLEIEREGEKSPHLLSLSSFPLVLPC